MALLIFACALVLIWALLAAMVGELAGRRGHSKTRWYLFSLFCSPLIGYFAIELLPSSADLAPVEYTWCRYCLRTVKVGTDTCPYCRADLTRKKRAEAA